MSNQKYTPEQRKEFKTRLASLEMGIPANYSEKIHEATGYSKDIIRNVRHGKTINFEVLAALEDLCESVSEQLQK